jgi:hypothetical protein
VLFVCGGRSARTRQVSHARRFNGSKLAMEYFWAGRMQFISPNRWTELDRTGQKGRRNNGPIACMEWLSAVRERFMAKRAQREREIKESSVWRENNLVPEDTPGRHGCCTDETRMFVSRFQSKRFISVWGLCSGLLFPRNPSLLSLLPSLTVFLASSSDSLAALLASLFGPFFVFSCLSVLVCSL